MASNITYFDDAFDESLAHSVPAYDVKRRGYALIIDNLCQRIGHDKDLQQLESTLKNLGFQWLYKKEQERTDIAKLFREMSAEGKHDNYDCFVCFILMAQQAPSSIENEEVHQRSDIYDVNMKTVPLESYLQNLSKELSLKGKPKLIFIQNCYHKFNAVGDLAGWSDANPFEGEMIKFPILVCLQDFFIAYANVSSLSSRPLFVQALCYYLEKRDIHIEDVIKEINAYIETTHRQRLRATGQRDDSEPYERVMTLSNLNKKMVLNQ